MGTPLSYANHAFFPKASDPTDTAISLWGDVDLAALNSDYNAFYQSASKPVVRWHQRPDGLPEYLTLAEWQALGKDLHSRTYDPADPQVAANIALYEQQAANAVPPLIATPCCARFLCFNGSLLPESGVDPSVPIFSQHMASQTGPHGWSDTVAYLTDNLPPAMFSMQASSNPYSPPVTLFTMQTFCGPCNRDGLLAAMPVSL